MIDEQASCVDHDQIARAQRIQCIFQSRSSAQVEMLHPDRVKDRGYDPEIAPHQGILFFPGKVILAFPAADILKDQLIDQERQKDHIGQHADGKGVTVTPQGILREEKAFQAFGGDKVQIAKVHKDQDHKDEFSELFPDADKDQQDIKRRDHDVLDGAGDRQKHAQRSDDHIAERGEQHQDKGERGLKTQSALKRLRYQYHLGEGVQKSI